MPPFSGNAMQRFILSIFSVVLATSAVAVNAEALPQLDPSFDFQAIRLGALK